MAVNDHSYVIIGGSTKCASSALFVYLADHPSVSRSKIKENRFFWTGEYELLKKGVNYFEGFELYDTLFDDKTNAKYRLEATPDYLYSQNSAKLIKENLRDVKLIFIWREPISRLVSWFKYAKQLNKIAADVSIDEYLNHQLGLKEASPLHHYRAVEQGRYGMYLQYYIDLFGRDKILIIDYDDLSSNPKSVMQDTSRFLNIDAGFYDNYDYKIINQSFNVKNVESFHKYRMFRKKVRRIFRKVVPEFLKKPISNTYKKINTSYMKSASNDWGDIKISDDIINKLHEYYKEDKQILNELKNKDALIRSS